MRQQCVIVLQEVHGSEALLRTWVDTQPYPYKLFFSEFKIPEGQTDCATGGVATLVPWFTPMQLEQLTPQQLPIMTPGVLVPGRVQTLAITNAVTRNTIVIMNVHNHDICAADREKIRHDWTLHRTWAEQNYRTRTFIAIGDFNTASRPPNSFLQPQPQRARLSLDNNARQQQPFWKSLFDTMLEIETDMPTRFNKSDFTASAIDRIFVSIPSHAMPEIVANLTITHDATILSDQRLSDHAILQLSLSLKPRTPLLEQGIHPTIFRDPSFATYLHQLVTASNDTYLPIESRWRTHKRLMREAAQLVRDDWLLSPTGAGSRRGYLEGRVLTMRSISRAVWRQDVQLARRVQSTTELGAKFLIIANGAITLSDDAEFAMLSSALHRHHEARQRSLAQQAAQLPTGQPGAMGPERLRQVLRSSQRRALLWAPWKRRLVLQGIKPTGPQGPQPVARESCAMVDALRSHWQPVFADKFADETKIHQYLSEHMPLGDPIDVGAPNKASIRNFLKHACMSSPGPDCLPYAAWLACEASLDILEDLSFFLCSGQHYIRDLNDSDFAFLPKGDNLTGELTTDRAPEDTRPLSLKNTDIKAIAGAANRMIKDAVAKRTHVSQQGFVVGRNFTKHIVRLDSEMRRAGIVPDAIINKPFFTSFDFSAAFPSLGRAWLFAALERFGLPIGYLNLFRSMYHAPNIATSRSTECATSCSRSSRASPKAALPAARHGQSPWIRSYVASPPSLRTPTARRTTTWVTSAAARTTSASSRTSSTRCAALLSHSVLPRSWRSSL